MIDQFSIGGPIPCCGCGKNIHSGVVHKLGVETLVCHLCFVKSHRLVVHTNEGLEQFEVIK